MEDVVGEPLTQNGATESFNGKFRDECLSLEWFRSRAEAKAVIEACGGITAEHARIRTSATSLTPIEFAAKIGSQNAASERATGRTAAVCGASALRPGASPTRKGHANAETKVVASKLTVVRRKPGRSPGPVSLSRQSQ